MYKYLTFLILFAIAIPAKAQLGHNYSQVDIGISGNANIVFGDIQKLRVTPSGSVSLNYNPHSPFVNYIAEIQFGRLAGGDSVNTSSGREFKNNYVAYIARAQVQAGEFYDYSNSQIANFLKNAYLSAGVGLVSNNIVEISRFTAAEKGYTSPGKNRSTEFFIPIRAGYEFKLYNAYEEPFFKIDLAYQWNIMTSDNLDGFDAGQRNDIWGQVSLGIKFAIGSSTSYRKRIPF
ncbi:MAG: hypothetical protein EOP46_12990 [Sphingobacteriaceae bacterium]|nr:MAG: hypothetical protein EOP46_12990 [Sphingobacteriaceae bacterium]